MMKEEPVTFSSQGLVLRGNVCLPAKAGPAVVFSHGLESHKDSRKWRTFARAMTDAGFGTLRFNHRGCGEGEEGSEGAFEETTLTGRVADLRAALDLVVARGAVEGQIRIVGSSFGGMVAIAVQDPRVRALALLATPSQGRFAEERATSGEYLALPSGRWLRRSYFQDAAQYDLRGILRLSSGCTLGRRGLPTLIVHGSEDDLVPVEHAYRLYESARAPKRLEIIEGGDHSFEDPEHLRRVVELCVAWFKEHLG